MQSQVVLITLLAHMLGAMAFIAMCFGSIRRTSLSLAQKNLLQGLLFGGATIISMISPMEIEPGVSMDGRSLLLAFAAAFGGPIAYLVTLFISLVGKVLISGAFQPLSLLAAMCAGLLGLIWHFFLHPAGKFSYRSLVTLGLMISSLALLFFLTPGGNGMALFIKSYPITLMSSVLVSVLVGKFIQRELRHIATENSWKDEALTDALTGLANRREFNRELESLDVRALAASVIILDVDHFKRINDTHGHAVGDIILKDLADVVNFAVGRLGLAFRVGGEEFAVILNVAPGLAFSLAENIRQAVEAHLFVAGCVVVPVTISLGVATSNPTSKARLAAERADKALYIAKAAGRNKTVLYDAQFDALTPQHLSVDGQDRHTA